MIGIEKTMTTESSGRIKWSNDYSSGRLVMRHKDGREIVCLIDDKDVGLLSSFHWCPHFTKSMSRYYVVTRTKHFRGKSSLERMHRVLMSPPSDMVVDHISGDTLDNRRSNLRVVEHRDNIQNSKNHSSGYPGVFWGGYSWRCGFRLNGKQVYFGSYKDKESAAVSLYNSAKRLLGKTHGFKLPNSNSEVLV